MPQMILCDPHDMAHPADWIMTRLENGETMAYCNAAYAELMVATVDAMSQAEADETAGEIEQRLAGGLTELGADPVEAEAYAHETTQAQLDAGPAIEPAHVVHKGQSARARRARSKRARARAPEPTPIPQPVPGPDEPSDEPTDEPAG